MSPTDWANKNPIYVGTRIFTSIDLFDNKDGSVATVDSVVFKMRRPDGEMILVGDMEQVPAMSGHYEGTYVVDTEGEWSSVVEIGDPETVFEKPFFVSGRRSA